MMMMMMMIWLIFGFYTMYQIHIAALHSNALLKSSGDFGYC
jgi:hypothetical protein